MQLQRSLSFLLNRPLKKLLFISGVIGLIAGAANALLLALLNQAIAQPEHIYTIALSYLGLLGLIFLSECTSQTLFAYLSQTIMFLLQKQLCLKIFSTPLRQIEKIGSAKLYATLTQDVNIVGNAAMTLPSLIVNVVIILGCFVYLYYLSPLIFVISALFMLGTYIAFMKLDKKVKKRFEVARQLTDMIFKGFQSIISGIKELKINQNKREHFFNDEFIIPAKQFRGDITNSMKLYAIGQSGWKVSFFLLIALLFLLPKNYSISHAIIVIVFLISPLSSIFSFIPAMTRAKVALNKIQTLQLDLNTATNFSKTAHTTDFKNVVLHHVSHTYHEEYVNKEFTLGPLNLKFQAGEIVFIIGHNGSGKSTLAKIICGLYAPLTGKIFLDDLEIDASRQEWYRQHFAAVFSDFYLFDRLYGITSLALKDKAEGYLTKLQLDHKITFSHDKFSTTALSDGQRKRLALLAAYLEDRPIYVFDEWASNQDPMFKEVFYNQLLPELKRNTKCVIVISHDEKYFNTADRIITLKNGQIQQVNSL